MKHIPVTIESLSGDMASEFLWAWTNHMTRIVSRIYDESFESLGIKSSQLNILLLIASQGNMRQKDIGQRLGIEKSTVSRKLDTMVRQRWIDITDGENRREQLIRLTDLGKQIVLQSKTPWKKAQKRLERELGVEHVQELLKLAATKRNNY